MSKDSYSRLYYVVQIKRLEAHISLSKKNKLHSINRTQFSLIFVYTCKALGVNISNIALIIDLVKQRSYNYGHTIMVRS